MPHSLKGSPAPPVPGRADCRSPVPLLRYTSACCPLQEVHDVIRVVFYLGYYGTRYRTRLYSPLGYSILYKEYVLARFNHQKNTTHKKSGSIRFCSVHACSHSFAGGGGVRASPARHHQNSISPRAPGPHPESSVKSTCSPKATP